MAKIEEITAILIDEIENFNKSIQKLSEQSNKIENTRIGVDILGLKSVLNDFLKRIKIQNTAQEKRLLTIHKELKKAVIIPKWMTVSFISICGLFLISGFLNFYQYHRNISIEKSAYEKGKSEMKNYMETFFDKNPKTFKAYKKWVIQHSGNEK